MEWIDASKKLPSLNQNVLVRSKEGHVYISAIFMQDELGNFVWLSQYDNETEEITHWMELPKAPVNNGF